MARALRHDTGVASGRSACQCPFRVHVAPGTSPGTGVEGKQSIAGNATHQTRLFQSNETLNTPMPSEADFHCRVCGFREDEPPWGEDGRTPLFDFCPCCGVEHGYGDATPAGARNWRARRLIPPVVVPIRGGSEQ